MIPPKTAATASPAVQVADIVLRSAGTARLIRLEEPHQLAELLVLLRKLRQPVTV